MCFWGDDDLVRQSMLISVLFGLLTLKAEKIRRERPQCLMSMVVFLRCWSLKPQGQRDGRVSIAGKVISSAEYISQVRVLHDRRVKDMLGRGSQFLRHQHLCSPVRYPRDVTDFASSLEVWLASWFASRASRHGFLCSG